MTPRGVNPLTTSVRAATILAKGQEVDLGRLLLSTHHTARQMRPPP